MTNTPFEQGSSESSFQAMLCYRRLSYPRGSVLQPYLRPKPSAGGGVHQGRGFSYLLHLDDAFVTIAPTPGQVCDWPILVFTASYFWREEKVSISR